MRQVQLVSLGTMPYADAWNLQKRVFERVQQDLLADTILSVEHPHTYTLGKESKREHLLLSEAELRAKNISLFEIDRGGDITYHGYGQFVAYPILNMKHFYHDVHRYLRDLEEVVIRLLADFGIDAHRKTHHDKRKNYTGVWIGDEKICALGVKFSRWTTMHGLALNVNTDLEYFNGIVPCGISDKGITSLAKLLGTEISLSLIEEKFAEKFADVFEVEIHRAKTISTEEI